jgi:AcrR family transcriptional regulator
VSRRTGRRPGAPDTRGEVLAAARRRFATDGYDGATIRGIATDAGVDPALIHHYFGSKQELFRAAATFPVDAEDLLEAIGGADDHDRVRALAGFFFEVWEDEATRLQMLAVLRSAMTHEDAATLLQAFIGREFLGPVARTLDVDRPEVRIPLAAAQMVGLAMLRYVVRLEPLASMPVDELVERVVPVLEHHLFSDA